MRAYVTYVYLESIMPVLEQKEKFVKVSLDLFETFIFRSSLVEPRIFDHFQP